MAKKWQLVKVDDIKWQQDKSGFYTLIHYTADGFIRLDIMSIDNNPLISFEGTAIAVRKNAMRYLDENCVNLSLEHAAYIGFELLRCETLKENYIQD